MKINLIILFFLPLLAILILHFRPENKETRIFVQFIALTQTAVSFFLAQEISRLDTNCLFQNFTQVWKLLPTFSPFELEGLSQLKWILVADPLAILFVLLTSIIIQSCVWYTYLLPIKDDHYIISLLFLVQFILVNFFCAYDLISFFVSFEAAVLPLFLMIGIYRGRIEREEASYQLYFYTYVGSILLLGACVFISISAGSTDLHTIYLWHPSAFNEKVLWFMVAFAVAIKTPVIPFHVWLPRAHVEAPTVGSVILAALILKLGGFTILRILLPILSYNGSTAQFQTVMLWICVLSAAFASFTALRQIDIKVIIAYSSVVHMCYSSIGLFFWRDFYIVSSMQGMLTHGVVSAGLFFIIGSFYYRYGTRNLNEIYGLAYIAPNLASFFFLFILGNVAFPFYGGYLAELGGIISLFHENLYALPFIAIPLMVNQTYSIVLVTRMCSGSFKFVTRPDRPNDLLEGEMVLLAILILIGCGLGSQTKFLYCLFWMTGWTINCIGLCLFIPE